EDVRVVDAERAAEEGQLREGEESGDDRGARPRRTLGHSSRCTVLGENAGRQIATYSAPSSSGVEYCTHSPPGVMIACPARTSVAPSRVVTRNMPHSTSVYSSNSGVCPGSTHPDGLFIRATLTASVREFTRPTNSSMIFGLFPAAAMTVGFSISVAMEGRMKDEG